MICAVQDNPLLCFNLQRSPSHRFYHQLRYRAVHHSNRYRGGLTSIVKSREEQAAFSIASMVEQLFRVLAIRAFEAGLNPAQWAALRHVATANESARSIGAFARLNRTTPSSASQTIGALVAKGLLTKEAGQDGRERILRLTPKGIAMLRRDPLKNIVKIIAEFSQDRQFALAEALEVLMRDALTGPPSR